MVYAVQDLLILLENYGIFDIVLPFFLVFAVVFGILQYMDIFGGHKGVHTIIALVIGLLAVRIPFLTEFYRELFPRLGIGITILLTLLILAGLFFSDRSRPGFMITLVIVAALIAIVILYQTFAYLGWTSLYGGFGANVVGWVIAGIIFVGIIIALVLSGGPPSDRARAGDVDNPIGAFVRLPIQDRGRRIR